MAFVTQRVYKLFILIKMQFLSMRWFWRPVFLNSFFVPLFSLLAWGLLINTPDANDIIRFFAGNITIGLLFGNMSRVASRFSFLKDTGALDYYSTLYVNKISLIISVITAFIIMSIPGNILALIFGILWLKTPIYPHWIFVIVLILGAFCLALLGAILGIYSKTPEQSFALTQIMTLGLTILSPVFVAEDRLPRILQITSQFVPTTYTVRALELAIQSSLNSTFWVSLFVLCIYSLILLTLLYCKLDWRQ